VGLDLVVESCPKPGHEAEWRQILERSFRGDEPNQSDAARFAEISTPPFERIGAPRVGFDVTADDWIIKARGASAPQEVEAVLKEFHGYYVLRLLECDGVPKYSHGGLYDGVDETSFRGAFLTDCNDVLSDQLIEDAWNHKFPEEAASYGRALLSAARAVEANGSASEQGNAKRGLFFRFHRTKRATSPIPHEEQLDIVNSAGRWFVFWGERGHAIRAWF
jgi:hypothetical protein